MAQTAAQRAEEIGSGGTVRCPLCDMAMRRRRYDLKCRHCGLEIGFAMACVTGRVGDETAAIWLTGK
jgi:hypothetical protein